jgi:hypothetical protein
MKDKILKELNSNTISLRDSDGNWFEGIDKENFNQLADSLVKLFIQPAVRVRFCPKDVDKTFFGTVIEETPYSYLVIPDDNLTGTARWYKNYCVVLP